MPNPPEQVAVAHWRTPLVHAVADSPLHHRVRQRHFPDGEMRALAGLLVVSDQLRRRLDAACAPAGISHHQYNVLRMLRGAGEHGLARRDIAERLIDRAPDVTRLLDRLARVGLIARMPGRHDRRTSVAQITPEGARVLAEADEAVRAVRVDFFAALPASDLQAMSESLERLVEP